NKDSTKGGGFGSRARAGGLGKFRPQRDHRDGESNRLLGWGRRSVCGDQRRQPVGDALPKAARLWQFGAAVFLIFDRGFHGLQPMGGESPSPLTFLPVTMCYLRLSNTALMTSTTSAITVRVEAAANAPVVLRSLNISSICRGKVFVWPRIEPETTETPPNSPTACAVHSTAP